MNKCNYTKPRIRILAIYAKEPILAENINEIIGNEVLTNGCMDACETMDGSVKPPFKLDTPKNKIVEDREKQNVLGVTAIDVSRYGQYEATEITIGKCRNENCNGEKPFYVAISLKPIGTMSGEETTEYLFVSVNGSGHRGRSISLATFEKLKCLQMIDAEGRYVKKYSRHVIDLSALKKAAVEEIDKNKELNKFLDLPEDYGELMSLLVWPGMHPEYYKFKKGRCYKVNRDGNKVTDEFGNQVEADGVTVICQYLSAINNRGHINFTYVPGMSPEERGSRIERRFWRPVQPATATKEIKDTVVPTEDNNNCPF